eukprot:TRINITY_DN17512_c0_g1_i1.p1 TRINITY_DN17512_c0_g1~~TRINITY_DN17512_c0_g1_i1.p1  ORF type:complete len:434 (+),score=54.35 TRINITY_DN17512_c0_g1_i1:85-1386(+)
MQPISSDEGREGSEGSCASSEKERRKKQRSRKVTYGVVTVGSEDGTTLGDHGGFVAARKGRKATAKGPLIVGKSTLMERGDESPGLTSKRTKPSNRRPYPERSYDKTVTPIFDNAEANLVSCTACVATSYNIPSLCSTFKNVFRTCRTTECTADTSVAHISIPASLLRHDDEWDTDIDIFFFAYGVAAYWGPNELDLWEVVISVSAADSQGIFPSYDREHCTWSYNKHSEYPVTTSASESEYRPRNKQREANVRHSYLDRDHFYLSSAEADLKLAYSFAIAQSEKLSHFESSIDEQITATSKYPEELATTGEVHLTGKEIARTKGQLFLHRMNIILHTDLLDTPDFFWERTDLEPLYINARKYFEVSRRVRILNERLGVVAELFDMLHEQQKQKHSDRLEWIVIWLIAVEIIVAGLSICLKFTEPECPTGVAP